MILSKDFKHALNNLNDHHSKVDVSLYDNFVISSSNLSAQNILSLAVR